MHGVRIQQTLNLNGQVHGFASELYRLESHENGYQGRIKIKPLSSGMKARPPCLYRCADVRMFMSAHSLLSPALEDRATQRMSSVSTAAIEPDGREM